MVADGPISAIRSLKGFCRALRADIRGSALPLMAAGLLPALAAIGSAVDLARIYLVTIQMQSGVDAAALAGARSFGDSQERVRQVETYFGANFPSGFMGAPETIRPSHSFTTAGGINVTQVRAHGDLPLLFMRIFGFDSRRVSVHATAQLQPRPLEVMVVLDNTGSMQTQDVGGGSRMAALKRAMNTFIETIHQGATTRPELAMGFVTYNVTSNVGDILIRHGIDIAPRDGFTNVADYTGGTNGSTNPLGWHGCVMNDATVRDLSSTPSVSEAGAWDVSRSLPGDVVNGATHPDIEPYHYPPISLPQTDARAYYFRTTARTHDSFRPRENQNNRADNRKNNHYLLSPDGNMDIGQALANSPAYRQWFYDFYIGLNRNRDDVDDVEDVVTTPDGTFYDPDVGGPWMVQYGRIPYLNDTVAKAWGPSNPKYGYPIGPTGADGYTMAMAQPNWQCPEPSMELAYGRAKSTYLDYIRDRNFPVMPASGTLHHIGMLWGYRLLARDDVFTRTSPIEDQRPLRALIFMTDGLTAVSNESSWFGAYGRIADQRLTKSVSTTEFQKQVMRRFAKVCDNAKKEDITVYIVSLNAEVGEFSTCAGNRYLQTQNAAEIDAAFSQIAIDLVDLHLTQ